MTATVDQVTISLTGDVSIRQVEYTNIFGTNSAAFHREARKLTDDMSDLPANFKAAIDAFNAAQLTSDEQTTLALEVQ